MPDENEEANKPTRDAAQPADDEHAKAKVDAPVAVAGLAGVEEIQAINRHGKPGQEEKPGHYFKEYALPSAAVVISVIAAAFTAMHAHVAYKTFVSVQRAFVNLDKVSWRVVNKLAYTTLPLLQGHGVEASKIVAITIVLTNGGNTLASPVKIYADCATPREPVAEPFTLLSRGESRAVGQVIGPKQTIEVEVCLGLPIEDVPRIAQGFAPFYVVGEVRYRDSIEPAIERKTRFVRQVRFFNDDVTSETSLKGGVTALGKHNCTDENCPE